MTNKTILEAHDETLEALENKLMHAAGKGIGIIAVAPDEAADMQRAIAALRAEAQALSSPGADMSDPMIQIAAHDPMMIAWEKYKNTPDYENSKKWATSKEHTEGSLWGAFIAGFSAQAAKGAAEEMNTSKLATRAQMLGEPPRNGRSYANSLADRVLTEMRQQSKDRKIVKMSDEVCLSIALIEAEEELQKIRLDRIVATKNVKALEAQVESATKGQVAADEELERTQDALAKARHSLDTQLHERAASAQSQDGAVPEHSKAPAGEEG